MSFGNQHMGDTVKDIRGSVEVLNNNIFSGITWENFDRVFTSNQEYGNTKFSDIRIVAYYVKNNFILRKTAVDIGYSRAAATYAVKFRLKRINTENFFTIVRAMIKAKLITLETIKVILNLPWAPTTSGRPPYKVSDYCFYAHTLVSQAIAKCGGRRNAAKRLGVKQQVIKYWADMNIDGYLIEPTA